MSDKSNYDYLLDLREREKSSESIKQFDINLQDARKRLEELNLNYEKGRFPGSFYWLSELDQLELAIKKGHQTFWKFESAGKFQL
jgi:hypothetical protein